MRGFLLGDDNTEPEHGRRDTELTLGSGTLLAIFFGLVLLCGLCFGMGYAVGRHTSGPASITAPRPATDQDPLQASGSIPKPSAVAQTPIVPPPEQSSPQPVQSTTPSATPPPSASPGAAAVATAQTAFGTPAPAQQPAAPAPAAQTFMVQVASVLNPEDADVLVNALKKRDYPVTAHRDPGDNFIRVRIGPFASHALADQWRTKLLNDGYNAVIQP
jgi:cell division septation protein DedD